MGNRRPAVLLVPLALFVGCSGGGGGGSGGSASNAVESCMTCHNASSENDYGGPGLENPHPFPGASKIKCSTCHGGDPKAETQDGAHVPPPPEIGDEANLASDAHAYFNRRTLVGLDLFDDYEVGGRTWHGLDYLQFVNPGDLRVVTEGRSCGKCHFGHAESVNTSLIATSAGILAGAMFAIGSDVRVPESEGLYGDTASDLGFRAVVDPQYQVDPGAVGSVARLDEFPVYSVKGDASGVFNNPDYFAASVDFGNQLADNRVVSDSVLEHLYAEQVAFTCGDCHLGSAGANNRYGDFRSSGCTACHMPYALDGRYDGSDPNVVKDEPANPDAIAAPERSHTRGHRIMSVAKTLPNGVVQQGIDDYACAGCHQGSNRTVMQFWGIRLDQNKDLKNGVQYPLQPVSFTNTKNDPRLFDPAVGNKTFNGRDRDQYILFEDYDGDGRDDTPPDVHYEAGMGCIDCHGSYDLHGGDVAKGSDGIFSRMEHGVAIGCESCHGTIDAYASTKAGKNYDGVSAQLAMDEGGNLLKHVECDGNGDLWLTSRLDGVRHYVPQVRDTVVDSGRLNPLDDEPLYTQRASYAMGRADGDPGTGLGPLQLDSAFTGFTHTDDMNCVACHASWTNTCQGCHLGGRYDGNNDFSNITGQPIVFEQANADFVYQSPIPFQLGVGPDGKITQLSANTKMFFQWEDKKGDETRAFSFSDRLGQGDSPDAAHPSLSHNAMMAHSIRGRVEPKDEGPRYCAACHLTEQGLADFGASEYDAFRAAVAAGDYESLDYDMLAEQIGRNPGNTLDSPVWVHMAAGLGSGLFLFDDKGCPVNPLDDNDQRVGCDGVAPADAPFTNDRARFDLDRIVNEDGTSNASNNHPLQQAGVTSDLRDGATDPQMAGPLGATLLQRLTDPSVGIVLDSWLDADGQPRGNAGTWIVDP
ncbi:MAG: hypothetical protein H6825_08230 [Planctomycetes bacterium]|nr:hypothetical protein [Planctomycetota bacterium]